MRFKLLALITTIALLLTFTYVVSADTTGESVQSNNIETINGITMTMPDPYDDPVVPGQISPTYTPDPTAPVEALSTAEPSVRPTRNPSATTPPRVMPTRAKYVLRHDDAKYNAETKEYVLDLYLQSNEYITSGTVGIEFDSMLTSDFDPTTDFTLDENYFLTARTYIDKNKNYFVYTWKSNPNASDCIGDGDGLHLGELKIKNVELDESGIPEGWHTETFRTLDWYTTPESSDPFYADYKDDVCLNDEIYNWTTGWYQGMSLGAVSDPSDIDPDNPDWYEWIDIGLLLDIPGLPVRESRVVEGTVTSYNINNPFSVKLLDSGSNSVGTLELGPTPAPNSDDSYTRAYRITLDTDVQPGDYKLVISKDVHLTYEKTLTIGDSAATYSNTVELYCGDIGSARDTETNAIIGDEKIKQNDRTLLIQHLNRRIDPGDALAARCDLNGDGKVTLHDLNIMKRYYNKSYK